MLFPKVETSLSVFFITQCFNTRYIISDHLKQGTSDKTKKMMPVATLAIVLLLSACLVVPSLAYADDDHGKKDARDNDDSHEKGKKDGDDKNKTPTCESEKYEKQCDDIAADKRDIAHDEAAIDKAQNDIVTDTAKGQTKDVIKDNAELAKAQSDLAADTADLTADLA